MTTDKITRSSSDVYEPSQGHGFPSPGFLVLDCSLRLLYANSEALAIIQHPERPADFDSLTEYVREKLILTSTLDTCERTPFPKFRTEVVSGNRRYSVKIVRLESRPSGREVSLAIEGREATVLVLLDRSQRQDQTLRRLCLQFRLSPRETEVLRLLAEGLTNKEIGSRLGVSTNTVKVFVHGLMLKMGVSGRSAIIARIMRERM